MIRAQDQEVQSLVADIREGKLLLPEMQRGYVWKATQVRDLFDSLYHDYPSGQFLVWETDDLPASSNKTAAIEGISTNHYHPQLLLDGQQRLTSLTAVMLNRPLYVRDQSKPIDIAFNVFTEKFEVAGPRQRIQAGWVSLAQLFTDGTTSVFFALDLDNKSSEAKTALDRLTKVDNIKKYKYRVNVLQHLSYAEVTHIFVRTNSGGTNLGLGDLALAQVSSSWQGVIDELEKYQMDVKKRNLGLQLDNAMLLRAIVVLLTGQTRFTRVFQSDKQQVTVESLKSTWIRAKDAFDKAINFLVHNCLIDRLELLPTRSIFMPLVAFFGRSDSPPTNAQLRDLQRWVYMALIWSRYSGASESTMDQDIAALTKEHPIQAMIQNIENEVGRRRVTELELREQRKNSPYMLMAYVLARRAHAQDWFNGAAIGNTHTASYELHHIFPKQALSKQYELRRDNRIADQVANLVFLAAPLTKSEAKRLPTEYLPEIDEQRLKAQYMPLERTLWSLDSFEECMLRRRTMLAEAINQFFLSLSDGKQLWATSTKDVLESRINSLEHQLRELAATRLKEARGDSAWNQLVPVDIRNAVKARIKKVEENKPFTIGQHETLEEKLDLCMFSDYTKIMKSNWILFQDVFGKEILLEQYSNFIVAARNGFKHNNEPDSTELASAEAGLLWIEACLHTLRVADTESDDEDAEEVVTV